MFFSISFPNLGVIAHSQRPDRGPDTQCRLRILTNQDEAQQLLGQLPDEEAKELNSHLSDLSETAEDPSVDLEGLAAASFSNFIATYHRNVASHPRYPMTDELLGFWGPPDGDTPGEGVIMWSCMNSIYSMWSDSAVDSNVAIVYSKNQATQLILGLDWLPRERQVLLVDKIKSWNVLDSGSQTEYLIGGAPAKLLCSASIAMEMVS